MCRRETLEGPLFLYSVIKCSVTVFKLNCSESYMDRYYTQHNYGTLYNICVVLAVASSVPPVTRINLEYTMYLDF